MDTNLLFYSLLQIYGWEPETYNHTKLPADMPDDIKNWVATSEIPAKDKDGMVWFSCEGENPADIENIGDIDWYPKPGVPQYFFPYKNQDGYLSPAVFAHFKNPKRMHFFSIYYRGSSINHAVKILAIFDPLPASPLQGHFY